MNILEVFKTLLEISLRPRHEARYNKSHEQLSSFRNLACSVRGGMEANGTCRKKIASKQCSLFVDT